MDSILQSKDKNYISQFNDLLKMIPKKSNTGAIVIVSILSLLIVIGIVLIVVFQNQYNNCKGKESPLCLTGNCPANTDACGASPFRYVNGEIKCKYAIFQNPSVPSVAPQK
jgi:hypothetical protein